MPACLPSAVFRRTAASCAASALLLGLGAGPAQAQAPAAPGEVSANVHLTGVGELDTKLDEGGRFSWSGFSLSGSVTRQFSPQLSIGLNARYTAEYWSFDTPTVFGPTVPWGDIVRPGVAFSVNYRLAPDLSLMVAPQLEWAYESGASASEGMNYGAVLGVTKLFSPTLFVGLGLGVFRQIDRMEYFPFVIVNWQINDSLRLTNPLPAGPAGGAGLELAYRIDNDWELAGGAAWRDYRFRLNGNGPAPDGLGQNSGAPVFARLTRKFGPTARIDLYAGGVAGGQLKLLDSNGRTLQSSDYGVAPFFALSGTLSF